MEFYIIRSTLYIAGEIISIAETHLTKNELMNKVRQFMLVNKALGDTDPTVSIFTANYDYIGSYDKDYNFRRV